MPTPLQRLRLVLTPSPDADAAKRDADYRPIELRSGPDGFAAGMHYAQLCLSIGETSAAYTLLNATEAAALGRALLAWAGVP